MPTSQSKGRIEVICGCMFSGKTEELIRRVKRAQIARRRVQLLKSERDSRYSLNEIVTHYGLSQEAAIVRDSAQLRARVDPQADVVAIDDVQFFDDGIVAVCEELAHRGKRVIAAGLDLDFKGESFSPMAALLAKAEVVDKLRAICVVCGEDATRTQRLIDGEPAAWDDPLLIVGASEVYQARCRRCHQVPKPSAKG